MTEGEDLLWAAYTKDVKKLGSKEKESTPVVDDCDQEEGFQKAFQESLKKAPELSKKPDERSVKDHTPVISSFSERALKKQARQKKLAIEATLDLHGLTQAEAFDTLKRFVCGCYEQQKRFVLVITGKGKITPDKPQGVLRARLREWIEHPEIKSYVLSLSQSLPQHGGSGAFYVQLRKNKNGQF